jgi:predicted AAA+ superfamily ATPase
MIPRRHLALVQELLGEHPAVALLGPRQVGKTTLALQIAEATAGSRYLDLESPADRARLAEPELYLAESAGRLVILDEVQRMPRLFEVLRGQIDRRRRAGHRTGQFLLLGSASRDLLQQSSESLAGRVYHELPGFDLLEAGPERRDALWLRGGFPESCLASSGRVSLAWRESFIRTYLERDIPMLGPRIPAETLRRFWTMLAHAQGGLFNAARLARGMDVSSPTIGRYLDLLVDLMLVRRLAPYHVNVGKRLVKSPKVYVRDSGLVHALLGIRAREDLLAHPVVGTSWEGFVIENLIAATPEGTAAHFYRTAGGAEVDLLLVLPGGERWAIEIKRTLQPKRSRGFIAACEDLRPAEQFFAHAGDEAFPLGGDTRAVPVAQLMRKLIERQGTSRG